MAVNVGCLFYLTYYVLGKGDQAWPCKIICCRRIPGGCALNPYWQLHGGSGYSHIIRETFSELNAWSCKLQPPSNPLIPTDVFGSPGILWYEC